ncbi:precorrin-3B C(17)-methyltransferase [Rhodovibrio salinarum]|uniref:Precorrin-3B C(17)-methyltransferase n=1 Tax=Rhodovibrio salinarum TaxID=1087 RepID=A0A934QIZ4_9PROT|nr:precorrin-3B C(17)-methyltransferase [Rhodovibrio salinarum]MBK1697592.1 precorrin-3B C(17)-methyltransferase [Rhodovibrio salinarum]
MSESRPAILALTRRGLATARWIAEGLPAAEVLGRAGRADDADRTFTDTVATLRALFAAGRPVVGVCAAGILVRALGPVLGDKRTEPPVLAVGEDGASVVPLLGGHRGANALARQIADSLESLPAVTTASDLAFGIALDEPPADWTLANPARAKDVAAGLLAGDRVRIDPELDWLQALPQADDAPWHLRASIETPGDDPQTLVYHPRVLTVGVGCERGCDPDELTELVRATLTEAGLADTAVAAVVSVDLKMDEPAVHATATALAVPARFFDAATLEAETPRLATPSEAVYREVGCHGVAEGAALAAAGADGRLLVAKRKSRRATCAIARAPSPLDAARIGRPRGSMTLVGLGPGDPLMGTAEAAHAVDRASDLVGYSLYLDLLGDRAGGKTRHDFQLGEEEARAAHALDLAAQGRDVALICSGDPGVYAMASPLFELLERENRADWNRVAVRVVPGISALQAAAARIGAPIGHDFCTVSLSDLLTPWDQIQRRLKAAAEGDFVVALYNPVSRRRTWQLGEAQAILSAHRPGDTPVVIARQLGRPEEQVRVTTLAELDPAKIDMLTVLLIGASTSRAIPRGEGGQWVYTPRGYAAKHIKSESGDAA